MKTYDFLGGARAIYYLLVTSLLTENIVRRFIHIFHVEKEHSLAVM